MDTLSELISIFIRKNSSAGIISSGRNHLHTKESASRNYFLRQIHPHSKESASRDYFFGAKSSPYKGIRRQGLFSRAEFIPIQRNPSAGIIFPSRIHPHTKEFASRDYFPEPKSSLFGRILRQGCFGNIEGLRQIPESNFRMHGDRKPHPDSRDISRCDHW